MNKYKITLALLELKKEVDDDENKEDYPPRKLILYGYIVESDEGEILIKSGFDYFSEETCITNAEEASLGCNAHLVSKDLEVPTLHEVVKLAISVLMLRTAAFKSKKEVCAMYFYSY